MSASIQEIAEKTGLSVATVRHILGNRAGNYRAETQERVMQAAREMDYRPNAYARAMSTGRFGAVALLLSTQPYHSYLPLGLLDGIHDALADRDLHLTLGKLPDEQLTRAHATPKILRQYLADGLLINYNHGIPDHVQDLVKTSPSPTVWINSKLEVNCVYLDDFAAGRQAAEHLLQLGHRRIAYLPYPAVFPPEHYSVGDRYDGYALAMTSAGLTPEILGGSVDRSEVPARLKERMSQADRPTAAVCYMFAGAQLLRRVMQAAGLDAPRDLSLIAFHDEIGNDGDRMFSTCKLPEYAMGQAAVEMLVAKIEDPSVTLAPRALPLQFLEGETCSPPNQQ